MEMALLDAAFRLVSRSITSGKARLDALATDCRVYHPHAPERHATQLPRLLTPAVSRITPWPRTPNKMEVAEIARTGATPGASAPHSGNRSMCR
jgi:hypothetical protein